MKNNKTLEAIKNSPRYKHWLDSDIKTWDITFSIWGTEEFDRFITFIKEN